MSKGHIPIEEEIIDYEEMDPRELADAISDGRRDFAKIRLKAPESFGSYVDSTIGVINDYTLGNLRDLRSRPLNFSGASLKGLYAPGIVLPYTIFDYADLRGADLSSADLKHARFVGTIASEIDFDRAALVEAIFKDTDLSKSSPWTDLTGVVFDGGNWNGADFTKARNIEGIRFWRLPSSYEGAIVTPKQAAYFKSVGFDVNRLRVAA